MNRPRLLLTTAVAALAIATIVSSCMSPGRAVAVADSAAAAAQLPGSNAWRDHVMQSKFCATCHPDIYAEHEMNTHGRAYTDPEVRLATGNFETGDCIRCHTPRPVFETGNGMNPQRRFYGLEEGNTCMTCHWKQGVDYSRFTGGADCKTGFDPRVGEVEACAACHKNHGTPYQWEQSPNGKQAGRTCVTCHMKQIERPIAVGGPVRKVRSHVFPGARNEAHVRRAYEYTPRIEGNEVVVTIANTGAGHNFPTELRQRSLESLIVVRDLDGNQVARSRRVFRDPYRRPYGLHLPTNTQIPSGESREHRVPLPVAGGTVDCELHYKFYFPIEDNHPDLARRLEMQRLPFDGVTPNSAAVTSDPETDVATPEGIDARIASPADLGEMAAPKIGAVKFDVPKGNAPADIEALIKLFNFQVPQANREAVKRLSEIGLPAVPSLIEALGSWDNKTFNQSGQVLRKIGAPAVPAVRDGVHSDQLYIRLHCRRLLEMLPVPTDKDALVGELLPGLSMANALDRRSTCDLLATLGASQAIAPLRAALQDADPDVQRSAAFALAALDDRAAVPQVRAAMLAAFYDETRIDLAWALARLGSTDGMQVLFAGLDHQDDLIRETCFERFWSVTHLHLGYEPTGPREERQAAIARLQALWAAQGGPQLLKRVHVADPEHDDHALHTVLALSGGAGIVPAAENDEKAIAELAALGEDAIPSLIKGLKFPPGFAAKRASVLATFGRIGNRYAAPFVAQALRDPVFGVAQWAAATLEAVGDKECLPALRRFEAHVRSTAAAGALPKNIPHPDPLLAQAARTRLLLGDEAAREDLVALLLSPDAGARTAAIGALRQQFGEDRGYVPDAAPADRRAAALRWQQ